MQPKRTPQAMENASPTLADPDDYLTDAECKCIGLHAMSTALTELLSAPYDGDYSVAARRRLGAALEIASSIEDRARAATELVQDARMIVLDLERSERGQDVGDKTQQFHCSRGDLIDFNGAVSVILDNLRVAFLAAANRDGQAAADTDAIALHIDGIKGRVKQLGEAMRACLDIENGHPGPRQDRIAEAGAA